MGNIKPTETRTSVILDREKHRKVVEHLQLLGWDWSEWVRNQEDGYLREIEEKKLKRLKIIESS